MIYLVDDKIKRQEDYGWNEEAFIQYSDVITCIHRFSEIENSKIRKEIFSNDSIILFHESFFDNNENKHDRKSDEIRNRLEKETEAERGFRVYFFSGSISSRKLDEFSGALPVSVLYQNLNFFLEDGIKKGMFDPVHLFFGKYPKIENHLLDRLENANKELVHTNKLKTQTKNLFVRTSKRFIPKLIEECDYEFIFNEVEDNELHQKVLELLSKSVYDNIFIPLCFGQTLSDYNGLRLATHIRCSQTPNQLKNIFIYGFVGINSLLDNEYFNILKTKNVFKINYTLDAFKFAIDINNTILSQEELSREVSKIALLPPKNYEDNHDIINEWAIYRWAITIGISSSEVNDVLTNVQSNLYFKYLSTIYPISAVSKIQDHQLKINVLKSSKVLYIDDEAEKGWNKIFSKIFDINNFTFDYLDDEFNTKTREDIVDISLQKIIKSDIDLVILDFRLHKDDFNCSNINEVTGIQLLKRIKQYNPGIQVVIFSATNKIWNLQDMQRAGIDGFIIKESPENSINKDFTTQLVKSLLVELVESVKMKFLKCVFQSLNNIENNFKVLFIGQNDLLSEIKSYLNITYQLLNNYRYEDKYLNYAYIQIFLIIELFVSQKNIFEDGDDAYVILDEININVQQKNKHGYSRPIKMTDNGKYEIVSETVKKKFRLDTNFRVSALLIFRFGNDNSSVKNWTKIYTIRNKKAAHYDIQSKESKISVKEIFDLLEFLVYVSDKNNISNRNSQKGLKEKTIVDAIKDLVSNNSFRISNSKNKR